MSPGGWIVVVGVALVVLLGALSQVLAFRREGSVITRTQLALRLVMALLLLAALGLALYGVPRLVTPGPEMSHAQALSAARQLAAFWTVVTLLVVVIVALALVDLRQVRAAQRRVKAEMYRSLARVQEELRTGRPESPAEPKQPEE